MVGSLVHSSCPLFQQPLAFQVVFSPSSLHAGMAVLLRTEPDDGWKKNWSLGRVLRIISARRTVDVVWLKPERGANLGRDRCAPYQINCAARAGPDCKQSMEHMPWLLTLSRACSTRCYTKQGCIVSGLLPRSKRQ